VLEGEGLAEESTGFGDPLGVGTPVGETELGELGCQRGYEYEFR
jgi:hypothetical protein